MGGDIEVNHPSSLMRQHHENEQQPKGHGGHPEEIRGSQLRSMVVEKGAPCLGGFCVRTMYLATVVSDTSTPSLSNSP
jgi:hypothetical protein